MFLAILTLVGGVVGSGFITGKEIVVFFARNGSLAYLGVFIAFILFYVFFSVILFKSDKVIKKLSSSKTFKAISFTLSVILSSAMFGSICQISSYYGIVIAFLILAITLILSFLVFKKGLGMLGKLNFVLVPIMIILFIAIFLPMIGFRKQIQPTGSVISSVWFSILYVVLNASNMAVLIASLGQKFSHKQKVQVAFYSALALGFLLLMTVSVLLINLEILNQDMPLLHLCNSWQRVVMGLLIFLGSETSLLSNVFVSSSSLRGLNINEMINFSLSIILPLVISLLGFGIVVTYLYPLASVVGCLLLLIIAFL